MGPWGGRTLEPVSEERQVDVAVVGGGPAGMAAALAASLDGASVTLIDEYAAPGGQIWRRRFDEVAAAAPASLPRSGRDLCAALAESDVTVLSGATVWAAPEPGLLLLTGSVASLRAGAVVLATGAYDRPVAFPGWTLPGVMTAGGAQALAKGQGVIPGRRVLLAGAGPFLLPVAEQLSARGAEVVASPRPRAGATGCAPAHGCSRTPAGWPTTPHYRTRVRRIVWGHVIVRAEGDERVRSATIAPAGPDWAPTRRRADLRGRRRLHRLRLHAFGRARPRARLRPGTTTPSLTTRTCARASRACSWPARRRGSAAPTSRSSRASWPAMRRRAGHTARPRARSGAAARSWPASREILADLFDPRPGLLGLADAGHRPVPLRGRHRRRDRRRRRRRRDDDVRAEDRHPLRPRAVSGPRLRAARLRAAAGARALQRPGSDPADPARRPYGFVVDSVNVSVLE